MAERQKTRSKTKEKILRTALGLLNNEGEANISSVDIASVMEISPGNLYYHYKGKDLIIEELFSDFEIEFKLVLSAPIHKPLAIEDNWIFLYILFEEIFDFRFFFYNVTALVERIPSLKPKLARLLAYMQRTFENLFSSLENDGHLVFEHGEKQVLAERLTAHFTFWLSYNQLRSSMPQTQIVDLKPILHEGVYSALVQITPYWKGNSQPYADLLRTFKDEHICKVIMDY